MKRLISILMLGIVFSASADPQFYPTDESLSQYNPPEWYQDAKLGYWVHWGVYSIPAFRGDHAAEWYGRWMYAIDNGDKKAGEQRGLKTASYHREHYGDPDKFGYKDFIPLWKAEKFDANQWADLFVEGGAKFFTMMAMHSDCYALWDSKTTPINSVNTGPHRDFVGEMEQAIRKRGLYFGVSNHTAWTSKFFEYNHYNNFDAGSSSMYGMANPDAEDVAKWWARSTELVEKYKPDLMWFDWCWNLKPYTRQNRLNFCSWYYNKAYDWGMSSKKSPEVVLAYKSKKAMPKGSAVLDLERAGMSEINDVLWMNDTSLGISSWSYAPDEIYRSSNQVIDMLLDIISKNGILLLNIGPKADGSIPELAKQSIRDIGAWLDINGEGVYATRPWEIYGEGPTHPGQKTNGDVVEYTNKDIRFTRSKDNKTLYIHMLGYNDSITIHTLSTKHIDFNSIKSIKILGDKGQVEYTQTEQGLTITTPEGIDQNDAAYSFKVKFKGNIPLYNR